MQNDITKLMTWGMSTIMAFVGMRTSKEKENLHWIVLTIFNVIGYFICLYNNFYQRGN